MITWKFNLVGGETMHRIVQCVIALSLVLNASARMLPYIWDTCNSCNIGMSDLPDMYAQSPSHTFVIRVIVVT